MNKAKATDAAHEISQMIATGMQGTGIQEVAERVYGAVIDQACDFIPDTELAAVIRHARHGMPMLIALDREQLYLLWVGEVDDGIDEPPTTCEMVHVGPGAGSVKVETRYLGRTDPSAPHSTMWLFALANGMDLAIRGFFSRKRGPDEREILARGLAQSLGWNRPEPESGQLPVAA